MIELATVIAAASIAATFFSDILSRIVKSVAHMRRRDAYDAHAQPAH
jgi:hypothetical protein